MNGERTYALAQRTPEYPTAPTYAPEFYTTKGWPAGSTVVGIWIDLEGNEYRTDAPPPGIRAVRHPFEPTSTYFWREEGLVDGGFLNAFKLINVWVVESTYYWGSVEEPEPPAVVDATLPDLVDPGPLSVQSSGQVLRFP